MVGGQVEAGRRQRPGWRGMGPRGGGQRGTADCRPRTRLGQWMESAEMGGAQKGNGDERRWVYV